MARADGTAAVLATVRAALRPVDAGSGRVRTRDAVADELRVAAARLRAWGGRATEAATLLEARVSGLTAYLDDLAWIIHENIHRIGLPADGVLVGSQSPLWTPKPALWPLQPVYRGGCSAKCGQFG